MLIFFSRKMFGLSLGNDNFGSIFPYQHENKMDIYAKVNYFAYPIYPDNIHLL